MTYVKEHNTLDRPAMCPISLHSLMARCWSFEPEHRPAFAECLVQIQELQVYKVKRLDLLDLKINIIILLRSSLHIPVETFMVRYLSVFYVNFRINWMIFVGITPCLILVVVAAVIDQASCPNIINNLHHRIQQRQEPSCRLQQPTVIIGCFKMDCYPIEIVSCLTMLRC